ncbi:MAG: ABC transporter permease subunit [Firmicutes bacterium]|nr:ABC transporter permease subunit [Bacillota bacterium]
MAAKVNVSRGGKHGKSIAKRIWEHKILYLFILPAVVSLLVFQYFPMYGATLAFRNYSFRLGIMRSPWVGLDHFRALFGHFLFFNVLRNTIVISLLRLIFVHPAPIILALLLNEVRAQKFKRTVQSFSYLPHFVSWAVVMTIMTIVLTPHGGVVNNLRSQFFGLPPVFFLGEASYFYPILILSDIWKNVGWGTIIYLSALTSINPELYESAALDGCGRLKMCWYVSLPSIKMTIGILLILSMANILNAGFDQVFLMQQPANQHLSEVFDTFIIRMGLSNGRFEFATAAGLFRSVITLFMLLVVNASAKKLFEVSIF